MDTLTKLRQTKPLVHHLTNWVTIYDCANVTRCIGALPVMAHALEESADMAGIASALVLNIGTLTPEFVDSMISAGKKANEKKIPVVLDAVGVGATRLRDNEAMRILNSIHVDVIKGNSSEIAKLAGENVVTKGVEATKVEGNLVEIARKLAKAKKATVVITGATDIITDGAKTYLVKNGHPMMGSIVGTGCMVASVVGAFCACAAEGQTGTHDYAKAAADALAYFDIAGELAAKKSKGPGSFKENFYDELYNLDSKTVEKMKKIGIV